VVKNGENSTVYLVVNLPRLYFSIFFRFFFAIYYIFIFIRIGHGTELIEPEHIPYFSSVIGNSNFPAKKYAADTAARILTSCPELFLTLATARWRHPQSGMMKKDGFFVKITSQLQKSPPNLIARTKMKKKKIK
jgi:hypothetical protein